MLQFHLERGTESSLEVEEEGDLVGRKEREKGEANAYSNMI